MGAPHCRNTSNFGDPTCLRSSPLSSAQVSGPPRARSQRAADAAGDAAAGRQSAEGGGRGEGGEGHRRARTATR